MPKASRQRILGLSPGFRELGFAVLEGGRLLYYGVRTHEMEGGSQLTGERAVAAAECAIDHFSPDRVAVATVTPDGDNRSTRRNVISDRIRAIGVREELSVDRVARAAARKAVTGNPEASREEMIETLVDAYPQLETFSDNGVPGADQHAADVFEAVGLAVAAGRAQETAKRRRR